MKSLKELGSEIGETLKSTDASDLIADYAEIGFDAVLEDGLLKEIPFVGTIIALSKFGVSINDRMLLKKLGKFLFSLQGLSSDERQQMIARLESDPAYGRKVGEHLLELLDRVESHKKPDMIAEVLKAYTRGEIPVGMLHRLYFSIEHIPSFEIPQVRAFHGASEEQRSQIPDSTKQAMMTAGLASPLSTWDSMAYIPNEVCKEFVRLNLDQAGA